MPRRTKDLETIFKKELMDINKSRVYKLNAGESIVDGNSIQLPCIAEYQGNRYIDLAYNWSSRKGAPVQRGIFVSGHAEYGVPTLRDLDTLVALESIFIKNKTDNGICELKTEDLLDEDLYIDFTINKLSRELGFNSINNHTRDLIKRSIEVLVATTITNSYKGGLYDIRTKKYDNDLSSQYHYIEGYTGYEETDVSGITKIVDVTKIKISRFFYTMIVNNYNLIYDKTLYGKTKNYTAKKIYLLALLWMGKNNYTTTMIDTLIECVPVAQKEIQYKRQYIKKALSDLNDNLMLNIVYDKNIPNKIYMCKPSFDLDIKNLR
ncbi:hypothetical protein [Clostridium lacusfryxellense]|uniref:hypothetical protein n=1 Tax=Clostridium lacusfryxellense TaxID=205328 RepID=UPI001C0B4487|nr:hypothetical protein [Clostridium lacusfryxellense]MBU3114043.1 hypothetical protein [Clostridium lacusfryxellense]